MGSTSDRSHGVGLVRASRAVRDAVEDGGVSYAREHAPPRPVSAAAVPLALAIGAVAASCAPDRPDIDQFPIALDREAGPVMIAASFGEGSPAAAVIDVLSPQTARIVPGAEATRRRGEVTIYNRLIPGQAPVARARFGGATIYDYDPCDGGDEPCLVGLGDAAVPYEAVIGTDLLADLALSFDFGQGDVRLYPDIPLGDFDHGLMCTAVFRGPYSGGGTLIVDGAEDGFEGRRAALGACMGFAESGADSGRGANALLLLSTGAGVTVLGESAYARYRSRSNAPPSSELPADTLHLPYGSIQARIGEVSDLSLAAGASDERGPCSEVYTHRIMHRGGCERAGVDACPCPDGNDSCRAGAVVDIDGPIQVAVIADDHPLLQSLRSEVQPALPDVDGILGAGALANLRLDLDYPNDRILVSCSGQYEGEDRADGCRVHPALASADAREVVDHCPAPPGPD